MSIKFLVLGGGGFGFGGGGGGSADFIFMGAGIFLKIDIRPTGFNMTGFRWPGRSSLQKRIALHGSVAATFTPIGLHCATKQPKPPHFPVAAERLK